MAIIKLLIIIKIFILRKNLISMNICFKSFLCEKINKKNKNQ